MFPGLHRFPGLFAAKLITWIWAGTHDSGLRGIGTIPNHPTNVKAYTRVVTSSLSLIGRFLARGAGTFVDLATGPGSWIPDSGIRFQNPGFKTSRLKRSRMLSIASDESLVPHQWDQAREPGPSPVGPGSGAFTSLNKMPGNRT
jgi:hypothetical protein